MSVKFVVGSGNNRTVIEREDKGAEHHKQRRALKLHLGLLRAPGQ